MDDSELFNLTVVELRSLCSERGLEPAKLRKKQIVELLVDNGVSEIPEDLKNDLKKGSRRSVMTPVKSARTTRRSVLTPQRNQSDSNITDSSKLTPRNARYQRFQELSKLKEVESSDKENEHKSESGSGTCPDVDEQTSLKITNVSRQEERAEELSDAGEQPSNESDGGVVTPITAACGDKDAEMIEKPAEEDADPSRLTEHEIETKEQVKKRESDIDLRLAEDTSEMDEAVSNSSFTTAASPPEDVSRIEKNDDEGFATPRKSRKRWSTSFVGDFSFAQESGSPADAISASPTTTAPMAADGDGESPLKEACQSDMTAASPEADGSEPPLDTASEDKDSPQPPRLTRQRTFTVETPSKSTPGVSKASKVGFKASKTPNFKKIHEKNQAKIEDIAAYSARRRDRMRQLLSTTREIRAAGAASREAAQTPKTPLRNAKALSRGETPASEKKILSNKVRSNRRFELLMKARGLPLDEEASEGQ